MTEELKTLKDFEFEPKSWAGAMANAGRKYTIDIDGLKQEAIKHIKFNEEAKEKNEKLPERMAEHYASLNEGAIMWIKYFFNITEEDLKGGEK